MDRNKFPTVDESQLKGVLRTNYDSPEPTQNQLDRRENSIATLKQMNLPFLANLPVIEDENLIKAREASEVAKRCIAIALCAVNGETQGKEPELIKELIDRFDAKDYFSPAETAFIFDPSPETQNLIDFAWGYECVHVLLWALQHNEYLKPPNTICDVAHDISVLRDTEPRTFVGDSHLRSQSEIFDMADLYYHLHWSAIELRIKGQESDMIEEGIIRERHRALNWLIRYMNQEWDEITTDT